jgi:PBSX family phage portal protein
MQEFKSTKEDGTPNPEGVTAIITNRGVVVSEEMLKTYEIGKAQSKQTSSFKQVASEVVTPPHNLQKLMSWMHTSVIHSACINVKKQDTVAMGFDFNNDDEKVMKEREKDANYKALMDFFKKVNPEEDIISVLKKVFKDWEGCGNGYIEVSRDAENKINGLFYANATNIRWAKDKARLVQQVGVKMVWFKKFGEEGILNKNTGKWQAGTRDIKDTKPTLTGAMTTNGKADKKPKQEVSIDPDDQANELIPIRHHSWMSDLYGVPEWLAALYPMFANMKEMEYNIDFFINFGIPAYAIVVSGATLNQEVKDGIEKFFETELKGSSHKTITLNTPKGAEIKFERLNTETKEASFRMYREDNRDEILTAHHVPPYRVGLVIQGQLGGSVAEESDRIYLNSVIDPRQEQMAWVINELIIKQGLQIEGWNFVFKDIDIADKTKRSDIHVKYFNIGVMSQNEIRKEIGLDPYEGGDALYISSSIIPIGYTKDGIDAKRVKPEQVDAINNPQPTNATGTNPNSDTEPNPEQTQVPAMQ